MGSGIKLVYVKSHYRQLPNGQVIRVRPHLRRKARRIHPHYKHPTTTYVKGKRLKKLEPYRHSTTTYVKGKKLIKPEPYKPRKRKRIKRRIKRV